VLIGRWPSNKRLPEGGDLRRAQDSPRAKTRLRRLLRMTAEVGRNSLSRATITAKLHVTVLEAVMLQHTRSSRDKVRLHRERLRAQGLRPVQIWVPDIRARSFIAAARKQSMAVAASKDAKIDQRFIDAVSERLVE
jgi:hypothetical protein